MAFDIERYKWSSKRLLLDDIDWDEVPRHHLPSGAIESMLYMMDIETHTVIFLSELLVSKACMDPVITSFLSIWGYEEMYHGEAFLKFLRAYGVQIDDDRPQQVRLQEGFHRATSVMTVLFGSHLLPFFPAIYLTIGATNELTTLTGYQQLIRRSEHPVLTRMVERIIKQERMHYAFYRSQAERLMRDSEVTRRAVRWVMTKRFRAVGEGVKSSEEVDRLALFLFGGPGGREAVRSIDEGIGRLPGMAGVNLLERLLDRAEAHFGAPSTVDFQPRLDPAIAV